MGNDFTESGILDHIADEYSQICAPILALHKHENGLAISDQGGFVPSLREWEEIKRLVNTFYDERQPNEIALHNLSLYTKHGLVPQPERERGLITKKKAVIPPSLRWLVWERDDFTCKDCGSRKQLSIDHIVPESLGGPTEESNLQTLCTPCNSRKGVAV